MSFPSMFWKTLVREELSVIDIQAFDEAAFNFVDHIHKLNMKITKLERLIDSKSTCKDMDLVDVVDAEIDSEIDPLQELENGKLEMSMLLQDISWTCVLSNGDVTELIQGGRNINVEMY